MISTKKSAQIRPVASPPAVVADGEHHQPSQGACRQRQETRMLRDTRAEKLDQADCDLVGELVIGASATELARQSGATSTGGSHLALLSRLVEISVTSALQLRMVPDQ